MRIFNTFVGDALRIIGCLVIVIGLFVGYAAGDVVNVDLTQSHNWTLTWSFWISSVVAGFFLLGMSQVVKFLYNIYLNTRPEERLVTEHTANAKG
jgi:hypothetical protein